MLQCQKEKLHERGRLRALGFTDEQIRDAERAHIQAFRPAFKNGQRRQREEADGNQASTVHAAVRRSA